MRLNPDGSLDPSFGATDSASRSTFANTPSAAEQTDFSKMMSTFHGMDDGPGGPSA